MGNIRLATLLLFAITYYVLCSCKFSAQNNQQLSAPSHLVHHLLRRHHRATAMNTERLHDAARSKRSEKYDTFLFEYPSNEVDAATHPGFERIPFNDYNRIVSALKEMLRAREEKTVILRPRPGRRSTAVNDFPLWEYLLDDDANNVGLGASDIAAFVGDAGDQLADTTLKKSAPFKPRLGKRGGNRICG